MKPSSVLYPVVLTLAVSNGADAGGIAQAVRGSAAAARITKALTAARTFGADAAVNIRAIGFNSGPFLRQTAQESAAAVRASLQMSAQTKQALKVGVITSSVSGGISGTISGNISKNSGGGGGGQARRSTADRRAMMSREINSRQIGLTSPNGAPEGVPQDQWDVCFWDIVTQSQINISGENNWIQIDGLPPICVYISENMAQTVPEGNWGSKCGESCIKYENMEADDFNEMADFWNSLVTA